MCRWILKTVSADSLPLRRKRLVEFIFQVDIIRMRKVSFFKTNVCFKSICLLSLLKENRSQRLTQNVHIHSHTVFVLLLHKAKKINKKCYQLFPFFSPLQWEAPRKREKISEEVSETSQQRVIYHLGSKYCNLSFPISASLLTLSFNVLIWALNHGKLSS